MAAKKSLIIITHPERAIADGAFLSEFIPQIRIIIIILITFAIITEVIIIIYLKRYWLNLLHAENILGRTSFRLHLTI